MLFELDRLKAKGACRAVGPKMSQELNGVISMVRGLSEGIGPFVTETARLSLFYKTVLKHVENFFSREYLVESVSTGKLAFLVKETLHGKAALEKEFTKVVASISVGQELTLEALAPLRTYGWLLDTKQRQAVGDWIAQALQTKARTSTMKQLTDGHDTKHMTNVPARTPVANAVKVDGVKRASITPTMFKGGASSSSSRSKMQPGIDVPEQSVSTSVWSFFVGHETPRASGQ